MGLNEQEGLPRLQLVRDDGTPPVDALEPAEDADGDFVLKFIVLSLDLFS